MSITVDDVHMEVFDGSDWKTYENAPGGWNGGTYHESCDDRDDLSISFKGTGIKVYGAKRPTSVQVQHLTPPPPVVISD